MQLAYATPKGTLAVCGLVPHNYNTIILYPTIWRNTNIFTKLSVLFHRLFDRPVATAIAMRQYAVSPVAAERITRLEAEMRYSYNVLCESSACAYRASETQERTPHSFSEKYDLFQMRPLQLFYSAMVDFVFPYPHFSKFTRPKAEAFTHTYRYMSRPSVLTGAPSCIC